MVRCANLSSLSAALRRLSALTLVLFAAALTGCANMTTSQSAAPLAMFGATCSPASAAKAAPAPAESQLAATTDQADDAPRAHRYDFAPAFSATCRPDHQFTHLDLALAFVDARTAPTYDFMPLLGTTVSPVSRRTRSAVVIRYDDIVDADSR